MKLSSIISATFCSALFCSMLIVFLPILDVGNSYSGVILVYSMYPFFFLGAAGKILYSIVLCFILYRIGRVASNSHLGHYVSGFILFVVLLDLCVYPIDPASGVTAVGIVLSQPFSLYALIPLSCMLIGMAGILKLGSNLKAASTIFGSTFILANTMLWI